MKIPASSTLHTMPGLSKARGWRQGWLFVGCGFTRTRSPCFSSQHMRKQMQMRNQMQQRRIRPGIIYGWPEAFECAVTWLRRGSVQMGFVSDFGGKWRKASPTKNCIHFGTINIDREWFSYAFFIFIFFQRVNKIILEAAYVFKLKKVRLWLWY